MQISLKWVNELVNIENVDLNYLIEKLSLGGFEVEEIIKLNMNNKNVIIFEVSSTANRSDSLSILGISKEIAGLINKPNKIPKYSTVNYSWNKKIEDIPCNNLINKKCSIFLGVIIDNLININTPQWLKHKLRISGVEPLNTLVDFQNYIVLETGYPVEFYDRDKINLKCNSSFFELSLTNNYTKQSFLANNGIEYNLKKPVTILNANKIPLSIAGIIGHKVFMPTIKTTSLFVEFSIFNSKIIRQGSRTISLRTERSAKYEKSLMITYLINSLYRLITLLKINNPNLNYHFHTIYQSKLKKLNTIRLNYKNVKEILGPIKKAYTKNYQYIIPQKVSSYLNRLNFSFNFNAKNLSWNVTVPISRSEDILREIDLIEEIGRLHGFNKFLIRLPNIKTIGIEDSSYKCRKKIISSFLNAGLNELLHYSLVNQKLFFNNTISIVNPLFKDCASLRSSLLPNLLKIVEENIKQSSIYIEGFEFGHVFVGDNLKILKEYEYISGILGGEKTKLNWSDNLNSLNWFEAKGRVEQIFKRLNLITYWINSPKNTYEDILHPYCMSEIYLSNSIKLGILGQIHPNLARKLSISSEIYLFEFNFEAIKNELNNNKPITYKEYSSYPKITKDLSFIVNQDVCFNDLQTILFNNGTKYLTEINLLDIYKGKFILTGQISLCLQLVFQSKDLTLQNKTTEDIISKLQILLKNKFGIEIRL